MEQLSARLLLTAGILLLIAGGIFAILQGWLYTGLLWAGAFGCLMAALNFRDSFLESATYLDVVPCRWGYVRLFNEGDPINFNAILCRTPQELYTALANDLETEIQVSLGID